jgi:hypothetical protein
MSSEHTINKFLAPGQLHDANQKKNFATEK